LERNYKYEILTEHDLGVTIDLILPETYELDEDTMDIVLDPSDEKLLEEEFNAVQDKKRKKQHATVNTLFKGLKLSYQ
jgi:RNA polymerase II-associated factor 1